MTIKTITIEAHTGPDVEITRIAGGALVTQGNTILCEYRANEPDESRRTKATKVAVAIYGAVQHHDRFGSIPGQPNCTGSMIYDVRCEIERLAGC